MEGRKGRDSRQASPRPAAQRAASASLARPARQESHRQARLREERRERVWEAVAAPVALIVFFGWGWAVGFVAQWLGLI